ncbi:bifunctional NUDIX hydrolase/phosphatase PAP2 family protein [Aeromonas eucrenophila]|uniref:undecaprenyl-diphosphate phosphatase n=1 Tax=Aeromonas eucrenophila TaxID=649 RepID=A0ABW0Y980_9GAMM|nr:bifunctional NUDIX hydrolase/phosphatase PAP2 family protein [Aeromonas eucrenophila]
MIRAFFFLLLLLSPLLAVQAAQTAPSAAACVIRHQQQLLLVQDRISGRYSLSGGYIDAGESAEQAALRELFEETGLRGRITAELGRWQRAQLFACQTLAPIQAQTGTGFVSLLRAPNLGGEILNARLIEPALLPDDQRRFPAQLDWLAPRLAEVPESPIQWQTDFGAGASPLHRAELPLIQRLQGWIGPDALWPLAGNLLGTAPVQLGLALLLLPLLGWPRLYRMLFAMVLLTLLVQLAKEGLGWPRPFHLDPALAQHSAQGFGMPSGHTASALLCWGLMLCSLPGIRAWQGITLALLLASLAGLARVWLGVHFISDVVVGLGLGALLLALRKPLFALADNRLAWWGLILLSLLGAGFTQSSALGALAMFTLGLVSGTLFPLERHPVPAIRCALLALAVSLGIGGLLLALPLLTSSSLLILVGQGSLIGCLGLWLSAGLWWSLRFIHPGPAHRGPTPT